MGNSEGLCMKYFVLKPYKEGDTLGQDAYAKASRIAMYAYAEAIENENPTLAKDIKDWVRRIEEDIGIEIGG